MLSVRIDTVSARKRICINDLCKGRFRGKVVCKCSETLGERRHPVCSSRAQEALFNQVRQWWDVIAARDAVGQVIPERDAQFAAGLLEAGERTLRSATGISAIRGNHRSRSPRQSATWRTICKQRSPPRCATARCWPPSQRDGSRPLWTSRSTLGLDAYRRRR